MNPYGTNAEHELRFFRERPGFLEQQVGIPFGRVMGEGRRDTSFKFQPVLYRRNLNRHSGTDARFAAFEIPAWSHPKLDDCGRLLLDLLREGASRADKQGHYQHECARMTGHAEQDNPLSIPHRNRLAATLKLDKPRPPAYSCVHLRKGLLSS